jgi:MFS family permease
MSRNFYKGATVSLEERLTWVQGVIAVGGFAVYLVLLFGRSSGDLAATPYVDLMLWTIGGAIIAGILGAIVVSILTRSQAKDARDREIYRRGEAVGSAFVVIGALSALILSWLEIDHFWIANAVYLCFVLSGILGFIAKSVMYRRGLPTW